MAEMKRYFFIGVAVGAVLGGAVAAVSMKLLSRDHFEFQNLSHGYLYALKVDKRSGESWGLTSIGTWVFLTDDVSNSASLISGKK
jgi:hypothetical protein